MPLIGSISIAMMASTTNLKKGLESALGSLTKFTKSVMSIQGVIAGSFAGAGVAALGHFAGLADDLSDNIERMQVMFGDASDSIVAQAEKMNAAFGTSEITFTAMATKMGGLFKALGVAEGPAAEMTNQLLVMGQAIANFKGISLEEAMGKVQAGMAGKGKSLKEFGISVTAAMSAQERFNAIMSGGADIIGAMDQRAMDAGASWTEFRGRVEQLEITLGELLPEMIEPFFKELNVSVVAAGEWFKGLKSDTLDWGENVLKGGKQAAEGMGIVQQSVGLLADTWQVANVGFHRFRSILTDTLGSIVDLFVQIGKSFDWVLDKMGLVDEVQGDTGIRTFAENWAAGMHEAATQEFNAIQKEWAKPWPSEGINAAYDAARKKIEGSREEIMKNAAGAVQAPSKAIVKDVGKSAGAALAAGGMGTASVITKGRFEIGDEGHKKKLEKNGEKTNELLAGIKANLEAGNEPEMMDDF